MIAKNRKGKRVRAKQMLRSLYRGYNIPISFDKGHGGVAGSLVGLGYISERNERGSHFITESGLKWIQGGRKHGIH